MSSKSGDLKKTITLSKGISLTIGSIVGSGLLALPGIAYVRYGSSSLIAWLTTALLVLPFAFIFSNLSSRFPSAGGIYEFSREAFGERVSQICAFIIAGTWPIGIPILALIGSNYIVRIFSMPESLVPAVAFLMLLLVSFMNFFGAEVSGNVQRAVVALTVLLLSFVVLAGVPRVHSIKINTNPVTVWKAMSLIFWAYLGFENITFLSGEFKNPRRDLLASLLAGLACVVFLYFGLSYVVVGLLNKSHLTEVTPIIEVINRVSGRAAGFVAGVISVLIVFINLNAWVWGASRSIYSASKNNALPKFLSKVNRYGSPHTSIATLLTAWAIALSVYTLFRLNLAEMFTLANQNFAIMYLISVAAYLRLNYGLRRIFGFTTLAVIAVFMFAYGYALIYPVALSLLAVVYRRIKG